MQFDRLEIEQPLTFEHRGPKDVLVFCPLATQRCIVLLLDPHAQGVSMRCAHKRHAYKKSPRAICIYNCMSKLLIRWMILAFTQDYTPQPHTHTHTHTNPSQHVMIINHPLRFSFPLCCVPKPRSDSSPIAFCTNRRPIFRAFERTVPPTRLYMSFVLPCSMLVAHDFGVNKKDTHIH